MRDTRVAVAALRVKLGITGVQAQMLLRLYHTSGLVSAEWLASGSGSSKSVSNVRAQMSYLRTKLPCGLPTSAHRDSEYHLSKAGRALVRDTLAAAIAELTAVW